MLAVTTRVTIETSLLRPPWVASTLFTRSVIGDTTQLLTKRWTEMGNVAEQSYRPLGEENVPPSAFLRREVGSQSTCERRREETVRIWFSISISQALSASSSTK